eukprot:11931328-Alexandrium_andersonii.AAC.1
MIPCTSSFERLKQSRMFEDRRNGICPGSEQLQPQRTPSSAGGPGRELFLASLQAGVAACRSQLRRGGPKRA